MYLNCSGIPRNIRADNVYFVFQSTVGNIFHVIKSLIGMIVVSDGFKEMIIDEKVKNTPGSFERATLDFLENKIAYRHDSNLTFMEKKTKLKELKRVRKTVNELEKLKRAKKRLVGSRILKDLTRANESK